MFSMTISWTTLSLSVLGPKSRSQWLCLEKNIVMALVPLYKPILLILHTSVKRGNILDDLEFERFRANVKVTVAIFIKKKKKIVIALVPSFIIQCQYYFSQVLAMTIPQTSLRFSLIGMRELNEA